jgi:hypothetical protein
MNDTTPRGRVSISEEIDATLVDLLISELASVLDYRKDRGKRYRLADMLACVVLAKLCGAGTATDIASWMADRSDKLRALGLPCFSYKTVMRLARQVDAEIVDRVLNGVAGRVVGARAKQVGVMVVAVDGKELTGSICRDRPAVGSVSVWDHATGVVLAQARVGDKGGEQGALPGLLAQVKTSLEAATGWGGDCAEVDVGAEATGARHPWRRGRDRL